MLGLGSADYSLPLFEAAALDQNLEMFKCCPVNYSGD